MTAAQTHQSSTLNDIPEHHTSEQPDACPEWVLPFSLSEDDAVRCMKEYIKSKRYLPYGFCASVEKAECLHVPYYLFNLQVQTSASYVGRFEMDGDSGCPQYFPVKCTGTARFERVPISSSTKMPDSYAGAIAPFDLRKIQRLDATCAAGPTVEVSTRSGTECEDKAKALAINAVENDVKEQVLDQKQLTDMAELIEQTTEVEVEGRAACLMPVWLLHCSWRDESLLFAVNGDTGTCVGNLPVSGLRRSINLAVIYALASVVAFAVFAEAIKTGLSKEAQKTAVVTLLFMIVLVVILVQRYDDKTQREMMTAVEARDAGVYYADEGAVVTASWRGPRLFSLDIARKIAQETQGIPAKDAKKYHITATSA